MPIKKSNTGALIWENPKEEEVERFKRSILEEENTTHLIEDKGIVKRLDEFVSDTLSGSKRLADSNKSLFKSLSNIAEKKVFGLVDIIIPVYGGYYILKECIRTVEERTNWPYRITIIDDCSPDPKTKEFLESLEKRWAFDSSRMSGVNDHQIIRNKKNKGFAASVNAGIKASNGHYICILNSDVLVTNNWLTKMVLALENDPRNKIVNPVTNNTALINVEMQAGSSYIDMNRALEKCSSHRYPEIMPTGFCFMIPRSLTSQIGFLDEGFENYGEETDYWMRAVTHVTGGEYPRWRGVLADDAYLFHERGSSFSSLGHSAHMAKRRDGSERFHARWPSFKNWQKSFDIKSVMAPLRATLPMASLTNPEWRYNIAFVTYSTAYCGGMKFIADIVNHLNENNVNAKVVQIKRDPNAPVQTLGELRCAPVVFDDPEDIIKNFSAKVFDSGIVIAATNELAEIVKHVCMGKQNLTSILFSQSHDPLLSSGVDMKAAMEKAYNATDYIISNAKWLDEDIHKTYGVKTLGWVRPGYDSDIFFPRNREDGDDRPTVLISLLKSYPFKGYDRGIALASSLLKLASRKGRNIRIMAIGVNQAQEVPDIICLGGVSPNYLSRLLSTEVDVFVDPSYVHTYGLPSLEAMASGVVPVSWDNYGINEYATHNKNALIFPRNAPPEALAKEIFNLLVDQNKLNSMKEEAIKVNQTRTEAVKAFADLVENKFDLKFKKRNIAVITPHLRKRGGPTTIMDIANKLHEQGHNVDLYTLYSDLNTELLKSLQVPIHIDWKNIKECDLLITNSDNPENAHFNGLKKVRKKALLKLSHNMRFQKLEDDSLKLKWDKIITSSQWLAEACSNPDLEEGWTYAPQPAARLGWYHYDHDKFALPPREKRFTKVGEQVPIVITTLAHHYPLKGTPDAMKVFEALKQKYGNAVYLLTVGEQEQWKQAKPSWVEFVYQPNREQLAQIFQQSQIWLNCSHTEGLGRMTLEAMSASCGVVTTDTGAEYAENERNCLITPIGSIRKQVEAVDRLIMDLDLRKKLATGAFETAKKWSDSNEYSRNLNKIVQEIFDDN